MWMVPVSFPFKAFDPLPKKGFLNVRLKSFPSLLVILKENEQPLHIILQNMN